MSPSPMTSIPPFFITSLSKSSFSQLKNTQINYNNSQKIIRMDHQTYKVCLPCDNTFRVELPQFGNILLFVFELMCLYSIYKSIKFIKNVFDSLDTYARTSDEEWRRIKELGERNRHPEFQCMEKDDLSVVDNWEVVEVVDGIKKPELVHSEE
ncbi:6fd92d59-0f51-4a0d-bfdc-04b8e1a4970e-CDS [Sclerotinia trifoliorum]|uniref:6fd92d59-0f51-4a0d-bfdc-04b8e1a4970e-CDS n=1 Tax=Sclerotinia trifoliorum TaxID=28548 RepID=A0A8H2W4X0_9HELO|nr:6fd92d59-0f51-4a0d-bfdc-04b8e1a4970e-CDS [Sclerotinia trifoliorum]